MNNSTNESKPCLIETRQGLSVLYKERYLYSKYNPAVAIETYLSTLEIKENTLVVCFSPVLGYGLELLTKKLPKTSFAIIIEVDEQLFNLYSLNKIPENIGIIEPKDIVKIPQLFYRQNQITSNNIKIPNPGSFKNCIRIDFSAGTNFYESIYNEIYKSLEQNISFFWKNRLTLVKLGRLYNRNTIKNLSKIPFSNPLKVNSINKTIIVLGAGPSLNNISKSIQKLNQKERKQFYIIAVDVALNHLLQQDITPDAVVAVESQLAIQKAHINANNKNIKLFADLSSRPSVLRNYQDISFFFSEFSDIEFIKTLKDNNIFPMTIQPLGSVGITATEIAIKLRKSENIPILVGGLDFSFSPGETHAKETMQYLSLLNKSNRIKPIGNFNAAFSSGKKVKGINGTVYTDYILTQYNQIFYTKYFNKKNIFNIAKQGLDLGIPLSNIEKFIHSTKINDEKNINTDINQDLIIEKIKYFYNNEKKALLTLKKYLTKGGATEDELLSILKKREYLYLHFPDGHKLSTRIDFLKRIRAEIDFFLKDINLGLKEIEERLKT